MSRSTLMLATCAFGIAGSFLVAWLTNSPLGLLCYVPFVLAVGNVFRHAHRLKHGKCFAVWTGEAYPWGRLHDVYTTRWEATKAVDKLRADGLYAYITDSEPHR